MNIIIGGGTGFIGRALLPLLLNQKHTVVVVGRDEQKINAVFSDKVIALTWQNLVKQNPEDYDVIINLAGANIAGRRWTEAYKKEMLESRIDTTLQFVDWAAKAKVRKPHLFNASAVGYYGLQRTVPDIKWTEKNSNNIIDESFSKQLITQWESAAERASVPVTIMRFGVVLRRGEGMLKQLELTAKFGMGAVIGSGSQPITWIDADDLVKAIVFLLVKPALTGVVNLVAPNLVTQKEFTKTFAKVLHRPALLRLPALLVKILFGQMGEELLLAGQAAFPERLLELGFKFEFPTLQSALQHEFI